MNDPKILIIEDEPLIQNSLKKLLEKRGARVNAVSSGGAAIKLIMEQSFDRIICDLMLQDISGFDVIEEARQRYSASQISEIFIIITAYSSQQVIEKAKSYGCEVVSKPFGDMKSTLDLFMG